MFPLHRLKMEKNYRLANAIQCAHISGMTDENLPELTPLDPAFITISRIASALGLLPFVIGAGVLEFVGLCVCRLYCARP